MRRLCIIVLLLGALLAPSPARARSSPAAASTSSDAALVHAVRKTDLGAVQALLAAQADPNAASARNGSTPLLRAAQNGHISVCEALLDAGARASTADAAGETPLIVAVQRRQIDLVKRLLREGAKVDAADRDGKTALHFAVTSIKPQIVQDLVAAGAAVDAADHDGRTPLMLSTEHGRTEIAELLLKGAAKSSRRDEHGRSAAMDSAGRNDAALTLLLTRALPAHSSDRADVLVSAAAAGSVATMESLLADGIEPNVAGASGATAILAAVRGGAATTGTQRRLAIPAACG